MSNHDPAASDGSVDPSTSLGSISWRDYIQWMPDPASEPTSTLVLTSPGRRFVDLRILKPVDASEPELPNEGGPTSRLEWGFAGTSRTTLRPAPSWMPTTPAGELASIAHCQWSHWIDSRAGPFEDDAVLDEGDMFPLDEPGLTLERGKMVNPATGVEGDYEECWREEMGEEFAVYVMEAPPGGSGPLAKSMIVRVNDWCQGIIKVLHSKPDGGYITEISVERWTKRGGQWERVVKLGRLFLPCAATWTFGVQIGDKVKYNGWEWAAVESSSRPT